ncbi:MAG: thiamine-phosphate kinase [Bacillota bacterium]|uniref:thiamine-phosphate kinase n=1 Tax=Desulforamulus profundi TaxID=1383067 RepID=UPI001EE63590|nr:thiamine-phosphate kinase [Desulforamulus profundi]
MLNLSQVGEFGLINLLNKKMIHSPAGVIAGIGDDAAVLQCPGDCWQLFTTDMMVEGIHFRLDWSAYFDVGYKALAVNISDIAAMGGRPSHGVVSIAIPGHTRVEDVAELYRGLKEIAGKHKVNLVGGDTVKSPGPLVVNIALLGEVTAGRAVFRSGARPGDTIYTTGNLGTAAAGLYLLSQNGVCPPELRDRVIRAHLRPEPRVSEGILLGSLEGVAALDDNSDGLAAELREICRASSVGCLVWEKALPVLPGVRQLASQAGTGVLDWVMNGGEDYELLFTLRPDRRKPVEEALHEAGIPFTAIGVVVPEPEGLSVERCDGTREIIAMQGYNHFAE